MFFTALALSLTVGLSGISGSSGINSDWRKIFYIAQKINEYDEGDSISEDSLMNLSEKKYKIILRAGEWMSPNEDQKEILALRAQKEDMNKRGFPIAMKIWNG